MATAETTEPAERHLEKEVVMVGYYDEQSLDMSRFKTLVTGVDLETTEEGYNEKWEVEIDLSDAFEDDGAVFTWKAYTEKQKNEAIERLKNRGIEDLVEVTHVRDRYEDTVNSEWTAKKELLKELMLELPEELPPDLERNESNGRWTPSSSMDSQIKIGRPDFDKRRRLAKESERTEQDMYETVAAYPSVSLHIKLTADSEEQLDLYTEEVIVKLHKALSKRDGVGKVRYTSCTTREEKQGECYVF